MKIEKEADLLNLIVYLVGYIKFIWVMQFMYVCRYLDKEIQSYIKGNSMSATIQFFLDPHDERDTLSDNGHHITLANGS